jgi:hypothetical protein
VEDGTAGTRPTRAWQCAGPPVRALLERGSVLLTGQLVWSCSSSRPDCLRRGQCPPGRWPRVGSKQLAPVICSEHARVDLQQSVSTRGICCTRLHAVCVQCALTPCALAAAVCACSSNHLALTPHWGPLAAASISRCTVDSTMPAAVWSVVRCRLGFHPAPYPSLG